MTAQTAPKPIWSVPVAAWEVGETGLHVDIVAEAGTREAIVKLAGIAELPRLEAGFDLARRGRDGLRVVGRVSATVVQNCVVTLEPLESRIDEAVDLLFLDEGAVVHDAAGLQPLESDDPPETLRGGAVDLAHIATEFLLLGIDPYPRKPGTVFDAPPAGDPSSHPFAALAALKKDSDPKDL